MLEGAADQCCKLYPINNNLSYLFTFAVSVASMRERIILTKTYSSLFMDTKYAPISML